MNALHRTIPLVLVAALLVGCGNGTLGDPLGVPPASEYGAGDRLCPQPASSDGPKGVLGPATWEDLNNKSSAGCQGIPQERPVNVTGLTLVAIDRFDETGDGATGNYYAQDTTCGGQPYSGVTVFDPSFSPPDLRLGENDVVDVLGTISEFPGPSSSPFSYCRTLPEVAGTLSFRFDSDGPPQPLVIPMSELTGYENARKYLGMLVKVEDVTLDDKGSGSKGRYSAPMHTGGTNPNDRPQIANELYDIVKEGPELTEGMHFKSVTGVVTYFFSFHIAPRSPADLEQ